METKCNLFVTANQSPRQEEDTPAGHPARTAESAAGSGVGVMAQDAPPSNTASYNCNPEYFQPLRWGVDSLYLTYPGQVQPDIDLRLKALKKIAQSPEDHEQAQAQYLIGEHIFEVKDKVPKGCLGAFCLGDWM